MCQTLVTDTSFVKVPVDEPSLNKITSSLRKRQEAADFILELRERRFDMLTGEYEVFPQGEAMETAIRKLDELEASYLSLFTGKSISSTEKRSYFIVPLTGQDPSRYRLGLFSEQLGFVPEELGEGAPLELSISPSGSVSPSFSRRLQDLKGTPGFNHLIYRVPDVAEIKIMLRDQELTKYRTSIYRRADSSVPPFAL